MSIANVAGNAQATLLQKALQPYQSAKIFWAKSTDLACGVKNCYSQPETLGIDRWAALIAGWHQAKESCIVVNAGTAVTIDTLQAGADNTATFVGGMILPGLRLMQQTLAQNTAGLQTPSGQYSVFPKNTGDAIYSGACNAIIGAIGLAAKRINQHSSSVPIIISGGDAVLLSPLATDLGLKVSVSPHLVLQGLRLLEKASST